MSANEKMTISIAYLKYWCWWLLTKGGLGFIYIGVLAEGLRFLLPVFGQKLHRLPGLGFLRNFVETATLDLAPFMAGFIWIAVMFLWATILQMWLFPNSRIKEQVDAQGESNRRILVYFLGVTILFADAILFYISMTQLEWGGTGFSFSALISTVAYTAVVVFISYVAVELKEELRKAKEKWQWCKA